MLNICLYFKTPSSSARVGCIPFAPNIKSVKIGGNAEQFGRRLAQSHRGQPSLRNQLIAPANTRIETFDDQRTRAVTTDNQIQPVNAAMMRFKLLCMSHTLRGIPRAKQRYKQSPHFGNTGLPIK